MKNILVAEDDTDLRNQINKILTILGISVDEAKDGEEGLKKALDNEYDLLLCDVKIPQMDGYQLIEELKKNKKKKYMPFIFITNIDRDQIRQGINLGANDYITKPFSIEDLTKSITEAKKALMIFSASIGINITKVSNNDEIFESFRKAKIAKDYAVTMGENYYYFYNNNLKEKFNELSKKYLSKYISVDEKRKQFRKNNDDNIISNFEIKVFFLYPHSIIQKDLIKEMEEL